MTGDTTPTAVISDEAVEAAARELYELTDKSPNPAGWERQGRIGRGLWLDRARKVLAAARPLLVSAEAERAKANGEVVAGILRLDVERLSSEVEGLRAELAGIRDDSDLSDAIGYAYAEEIPMLRDGAVARQLRSALYADCGHGVWEPTERSDTVVECIVCGTQAELAALRAAGGQEPHDDTANPEQGIPYSELLGYMQTVAPEVQACHLMLDPFDPIDHMVMVPLPTLSERLRRVLAAAPVGGQAEPSDARPGLLWHFLETVERVIAEDAPDDQRFRDIRVHARAIRAAVAAAAVSGEQR